MKNYSIGVLGGMGTYATIRVFQQYASIFPADKEWDRPRIVIDNNCTMPSRVRAFLYGENKDILVAQMAESIKMLLHGNITRIILACNTSHLFLSDVYKLVPEAKNKIVNIIDVCVKALVRDHVEKVYLLASEGTIESRIYQNKLRDFSIECTMPSNDEFGQLRKCIEAVKQNKYDDEIKNIFSGFVNKNSACILGCTELPILYEKYLGIIESTKVYDPIEESLKLIRMEYEKNQQCI